MVRDELKLPGDDERNKGNVSPAWITFRWIVLVVAVYLIVDGLIGILS